MLGDLEVVLFEMAPDGTITRSAVYDPGGQVLVQHVGAASCLSLAAARLGRQCRKRPPGAPPGRRVRGERTGACPLVVDADGAVANRYAYGPYGQTLAAATQATVGNPFGFTGQMTDPEINGLHLRAREYLPGVLRFTGPDPVKGDPADPLSRHGWLYCQNDPVNGVDPQGLTSKEETAAATSTAAGLAGAGAGPQLGSILQNMRSFVDLMNQRAWIYQQTVTQAASKQATQWAQAMNQVQRQLHHIVGRGWGNTQKFGREVLNSAQNLINMDAASHGKITAFMNSGARVHRFMAQEPDYYGQVRTLQEFVSQQTYVDQWRWGASLLVHLATHGELASFSPADYGLVP